MTSLENSVLVQKTSNYLESKLSFSNLSSFIKLSSTLDIFGAANSQLLSEKNTTSDSLKLYSPFNDYFGLVNIIKTTSNTLEINCKMAMRPFNKIIGQDGFSSSNLGSKQSNDRNKQQDCEYVS